MLSLPLDCDCLLDGLERIYKEVKDLLRSVLK